MLDAKRVVLLSILVVAVIAYLAVHTALWLRGQYPSEVVAASGSARTIHVEVYPGTNVNGYHPLLVFVSGVPASSKDRLKLCVRVALRVHIEPRELESFPYIKRYAETPLVCLKPRRLPWHRGDSLVFTVPGVPATTAVYNSSAARVTNGKYILEARLNATLILGDKPIYNFTVEYRPSIGSKPLVLLANDTPAYTINPDSRLRFCTFILHGLPLNETPRLAIVQLPSGASEELNAGIVVRPYPESFLAEKLNESLHTLFDSFNEYVKVDNITGLYNVSYGVEYYCADIKPREHGLVAGTSAILYARVGNYTSDPVALYPYNPSSEVKILIVDPGLLYALQALNPHLDLMEGVLREWGLWGKSGYWLAYTHARYSGVYWHLRREWSSVPFPFWGRVVSLAGAEIVTNVTEAMRRLEHGGYRVVVLAGWWFWYPRDWARLLHVVLDGVLEGRFSVVATGLSLASMRLGDGYYIGSPVPLHSLYGNPLADSISKTLTLYSNLVRYNGTLFYMLRSAPLPPIAALLGSMASTIYAKKELGIPAGVSISITTPLPVKVKSLGYRAYGSLDWFTLYADRLSGRLKALAGDTTLHEATKRLLESIVEMLGYPLNATLVGESVAAMLAWAPRLLSQVLSGEVLNDGIVAGVELLNDTLGFSLEPRAARLLYTSLEPRLLLVGEDSAVIELVSCNGARVLYSSVPLELDTQRGVLNGPSILARLVVLAARRASECKTLHGLNLPSSVASTVEQATSGYLVASAERVLILPRGWREVTTCTGGLENVTLLLVPLGARIALYENNTRLDLESLGDGVYKVRLVKGCHTLRLRGEGGLLPATVYLVLYGSAPGVVTRTVTTTTTVTTTSVRTVTSPIVVTVTATVTRVKRETVTTTVTRATTITSVTTYIVTRSMVKTTTVTRHVPVTVPTTVYNVTTLTVTSTKLVEKTVTRNTTIVRVKTSTVVRVVTRSQPMLLQPAVMLAAGLAGGVAIGYLVPRLITRLRSE